MDRSEIKQCRFLGRLAEARLGNAGHCSARQGWHVEEEAAGDLPARGFRNTQPGGDRFRQTERTLDRVSRLLGGLVKPRANFSTANKHESDHKVNDAELDAFMASLPVESAELVTV